MDEKECTKCGETTPLDEFANDRTKRDGRSTRCRTCRQVADRERWARGADQINARRRATHAANPEKLRAVARAKYERDASYRAARRSRARRQRAEKPEQLWAGHYRHAARARGFDPVVEDFTKDDVIEKYGDACFYCETGAFEELDHFHPTSKGGLHTLENVRPSCLPCNRMKQDADPDEWLAEQAALDDLTEDELDDLIDVEIDRWTQPKESK